MYVRVCTIREKIVIKHFYAVYSNAREYYRV